MSDDDYIKEWLSGHEDRLRELERQAAAARERSMQQTNVLCSIEQLQREMKHSLDSMNGVIQFGKWLTATGIALSAVLVAVWRSMK